MILRDLAILASDDWPAWTRSVDKAADEEAGRWAKAEALALCARRGAPGGRARRPAGPGRDARPRGILPRAPGARDARGGRQGAGRGARRRAEAGRREL